MEENNMSMFDANGKFSTEGLFKYARDLTIVQAVRKGIDVPIADLDAVDNVGACMLALAEAENALEADNG